MKTIITQERQTLFDIALQHCGDANAAFEIAEINNISLSGVPAVGTSMEVPEPEAPLAKRIVEYYALNKISPATDDDSVANETIITSIGKIALTTINENKLITTII
jgi:hypothetical protein